jgi:hypothetical protein
VFALLKPTSEFLLTDYDSCLFGINKYVSEKLLAANDMAQQQLDVHNGALDNLDELAEIMTEMLQRQEQVEARGLCLWL